jgi:protein ImuA
VTVQRSLIQSCAGGKGKALSSVSLGHASADACLGGLRRGALHEVFAGSAGQGAAATGFAAALAMRACANRRLLWVREDFAALEHGELCATGLLELGLDPDRLILVRVANALNVLRSAADALSCGGLGAVVIEIMGQPQILGLTASRRLVLAAARKNVPAFLLRLGAAPASSAAETRWIVRAARSADAEDWGLARFDVQLARNRHGPTGHFVMEWSSDDGLFRAPDNKFEAHSGAVVPALADRSYPAPGAQRPVKSSTREIRLTA